jgi:hypothetical protein
VTATTATEDCHRHMSNVVYLAGCRVSRGVRIPCKRQVAGSIPAGGSSFDQPVHRPTCVNAVGRRPACVRLCPAVSGSRRVFVPLKAELPTDDVEEAAQASTQVMGGAAPRSMAHCKSAGGSLL